MKVDEIEFVFVLFQGMKYANIALRLIIVYIVRQYQVITHCKLEDLQFRMDITQRLISDKIFEIKKRSTY